MLPTDTSGLDDWPGPGFPIDDYTPHGYLDIPTHTRQLNRAGVVRSHDVGFRWHFPALGTGYGGRRETYRTGLRVGVDQALALADFDRVTAPYHSKDIVEFDARHPAGSLRVRFHLVGEHVIVARVRGPRRERLTVRIDYARILGADAGWGESGLVGRCDGDLTILQGFEDGDAFAVWTTPAPTARTFFAGTGGADPDTGDLDPAGRGTATAPGPVTVIGDPGTRATVSAVIEYTGTDDSEVTVLLARGRTASEATARLRTAAGRRHTALAAYQVTDARFWATAPRLGGDWPDHWRRGLVYDLETLRMMVKPPAGRYTHPWDAMQIQAPRVVLGEAAIDALLLSYADPGAAQEMMLGTFADASAANVPCSREDGSLNMVAADGSACGTGPQWGYPWTVLSQLYQAHPDPDWLAEIYPHLGAYLDWWLEHRRDHDGWLVHACSWESGQDLSPRFGDQPLGGGHPTRHIRPVDLHAAFADAAATMARFATILRRERDTAGWQRLADDYGDRTAQLWTGSRYADVDARTGQPTSVDDVMLWAPLALGLADTAQAAALRPAVGAVDADTVEWPMFAWTAIDAALAVGAVESAAGLAAGIVDRAYRFWDDPVHREGHTKPGIACEYWPLSGACGGEGYGWGAFSVHLVIGVLAGIRVTETALQVRPNLPSSLRRPGHSYPVTLTCRGTPVTVTLRPRAEGDVRVLVEPAGPGIDGGTADLAWGTQASWRVRG